MSKPVYGDPNIDIELVETAKDVVGQMQTFLIDLESKVKNLDEDSSSEMRDLIYTIGRICSDLDHVTEKHSRALLRKAIGGK